MMHIKEIFIYFLFIIAIYYGISSIIKYKFNRDINKIKKTIFMVSIAVLMLSPFVTHFTLLKTSYSYNEMLDRKAYSQLIKELTPHHIDKYYLDSEDLVYFPMYQIDVFNDISFHSTRWGNERQQASSTDKKYNLVTIHLNNTNKTIRLFSIDEHSDIFRTHYNDRPFNVLLPKLRNLLDEKLAELE